MYNPGLDRLGATHSLGNSALRCLIVFDLFITFCAKTLQVLMISLFFYLINVITASSNNILLVMSQTTAPVW